MANVLDDTVLEDGFRNAVVRLAGVLDTSDVTWNEAIRITDFTNNDPNFSALRGFRIDKINYSIAPVLAVVLEWNSNAPQLIGSFHDSNEVEWKTAGGLQPNLLVSGFNGSINLRTTGFTPTSAGGFTVTISMVKLYS